jgi:hypothetical protein
LLDDDHPAAGISDGIPHRLASHYRNGNGALEQAGILQPRRPRYNEPTASALRRFGL